MTAVPSDSLQRPRLPWGRLLAGTLFGAACLALVLYAADPAAVMRQLRATELGWLALAFASALAVAVTKALRWQALLYYGQEPRRGVPLRPTFEVLLISQMVNILIPVRLGEIVRIFVLHRLAGPAKATILSTIAVEKLLDLICVGLVAVLVVPMAIGANATAEADPRTGWLRLGIAVAAVVALAFAGRWHRPVIAWARAHVFPRLPRPVQGPLERLAEATLVAFVELSEPRPLAVIGGWSLLAWLFSVITYYLLLASLNIAVPPVVGLVLFATVQLSFVTPTAPGGIGLPTVMPVWVLQAFAVSPDAATAFGILAYLVVAGPPMVIGAFCLGQYASLIPRLRMKT